MNLKLLLKVTLNEKEMNYWYILQMGEYQNGYAEWKKLDPKKKKKYILYDSILSLEMQNAK